MADRPTNAQVTNNQSKDPRVEAALREYLERMDRGESIDREEFLARHAEIAGELRSFIGAEQALEKLAGVERSPRQSGHSTRSFSHGGQETLVPRGLAGGAEGSHSGLKTEFGRYRIVRALGQGAMGTVYLAEDTQLQRQVALKTPHMTEILSEESRERFYREARAAATLRHPHICPVYDVGEIEGTHYISMAYIDGRPLSAFIKTDKIQSERQILIVIRKLALALQEAHDHGIVHRDLKPANVMVDKKGEPIIMDFGLARQVHRDQNIRITQTGVLIGTPAYMSPEQIEGESEKITPRTDQYSLGVILYELLTGRLPYRGTMMAVMGQILTKAAVAPSQFRTGLDPRIEAACLKMMAKTPAERFASLSAAAEELATILRNPPAKPTAAEKLVAEQPAAAEKPSSTEKPVSSADRSTSPSIDRDSAASASRIMKTVSGKDLTSLEELAQKCLVRHDYDQVIQIIERIPEEKRTPALNGNLVKARAKADEIAFLICDIDEAARLNDGPTVLRKADELLKIKPAHHRALEVQKQFGGYGTGGAARIGSRQKLIERWNEGGWFPWSVLAFGVAVFGVMTAVIVIMLGKATIEIDVKDPDVTVAVKGADITITGPKQEPVRVSPGDQELTVSYAGLETLTRRFTLGKGQKRTVTVSLVDRGSVKTLVATLDGEHPPAVPADVIADREKTKVAAAVHPPLPAAPFDAAVKSGTSSAGAGSATSQEGFIPLFNGRDSTGWHPAPGSPSNWRVKNGILIGSGPKSSYLDSDRGDFQDFHLRVEARVSAGGNSGVYFRTKSGDAGYQADISDPPNTLSKRTGTLTNQHKILVSYLERPVPQHAWFIMKVIAEGNRIRIFVNDKQTAEYTDAERRFTSGHISLQQALQATVVEFRKIEIRELSPNPATGVANNGARHLWKGTYSSFENTGRGKWHETFYKNEPGNDFDEVARTVEFVEFFDPTRKMRIRLSDKRARFIIDGNGKDSGTFQTGRWEPEGTSSVSADTRPAGAAKHLIRHLWNGSYSLFENTGPGKWRETSDRRGTTFNFDEVVQTADYVELIDKTRGEGGVRVRLRDDEMLMIWGGRDKDWRTTQRGEWKASPAVPANAAETGLVAPFDELAAQRAQREWADRLKSPVELVNSAGMRLRLIPPGQFRMGSDQVEEDKKPAHLVRISRAFYLGTYEVTRGEFAKFVNATAFKATADRHKGGWRLDNSAKSSAKLPEKWESNQKYTWRKPGFPQENNHPVIDVTWDDARAFCEWLHIKDGRTYRLPTEAEWEYACRAGTTARTYKGSNNESLTQIGNVADVSASEKFPEWRTVNSSDGWAYTSPVGHFRPNNFGLHDMLGNANEWCSDWYGNDYYKNSPDSDPPGPSAGKRRVARGGSFLSIPTAFGRWHLKPDHHGPSVGFRVVCEIPLSPPGQQASAPLSSPPKPPAGPAKPATGR